MKRRKLEGKRREGDDKGKEEKTARREEKTRRLEGNRRGADENGREKKTRRLLIRATVVVDRIAELPLGARFNTQSVSPEFAHTELKPLRVNMTLYIRLLDMRGDRCLGWSAGRRLAKRAGKQARASASEEEKEEKLHGRTGE